MIKVMTFNLRNETAADGINRFFLRTHRVLEAIRNEDPHLIGFQEVTDEMRAFLRDALKEEYAFIGGGFDKNYRSVGNPIAFKRDALELVGLETKWLSGTPDIPGSRYEESDQSKYPRYYHFATFRVIATNELLQLVNTHTDHTGKEARVLESRQLLELLRRISNRSTVLMGDLNSTPDSEEIRLLSSEPALGIKDVTAHIPGTFHWWGSISNKKIDYIFTNLSCLESHAVEDIPVDGVYISDHNPVVATLELPGDNG